MSRASDSWSEYKNGALRNIDDKHCQTRGDPEDAAADPQQGGANDKGKHTEREPASTSAPPDVADEEQQSSPPKPERETGDDKGKSAAIVASPAAWQAIYSSQYNTYYFYNAETQEITWTNPLSSAEPAASTSTVPEPDAQDPAGCSSMDPRYVAMQQVAIAQVIDALAYLDPSLTSPMPSTSVGPDGMSFTARFNAATGQFTRPDGRDPTHLPSTSV